MASSGCCPRRYFMLAMFAISYIIATGFRGTFSLVMTHVSKVNQTDSEDNLFPNCSTIGQDYHVAWAGDDVAFLHTTYFLGNLMTQIIGGVLAIRFPPKNVIAAVICTASVLYLILPQAIMSYYELTATIRFVQGLLEGCIVPAGYGFLAAWAPTRQRSLFVGIANSGAYFSPAIALIVTGALTCYVQWDAVLYFYGSFGIIWTAVALLFVYDTPQQDPKMGDEERFIYEKDTTKVKPSGLSIVSVIPWKGLLTSMPVYAVLAGSICRNWMFSIMLTLQPEYFKDAFGMNTATIGILSCVPHVCMGTMAVTSGYVVDYLIANKWISRTNARKLASAVGFGTEGFCVIGLYFVESHQWKLGFALLTVGVGVSGCIVSGYQSNQMEIAPQFTSVITAFSRFGTISGILSTALIGVMVGDTHAIEAWQNVFLVSGLINLCGLTFFLIFSSAEVQSWARIEELSLVVDDKKEKQKSLEPVLKR